MLYDLKPQIIENFFTQDEVNYIYHDLENKGLNDLLTFDNVKNRYFNKVEDFGYISSGIQEEFLKEKIKNVAENIFKTKFINVQAHFARYTVYSGAHPELAPHVDVFLEHPAHTLSIQLKTTKPEWVIRVDDYSFTLKENFAVTFSGTHQIHSRDIINFANDDYCDIIVCQLYKSEDGQSLINNMDHKIIIDAKFKDHISKYRNNK